MDTHQMRIRCSREVNAGESGNAAEQGKRGGNVTGWVLGSAVVHNSSGREERSLLNKSSVKPVRR